MILFAIDLTPEQIGGLWSGGISGGGLITAAFILSSKIPNILTWMEKRRDQYNVNEKQKLDADNQFRERIASALKDVAVMVTENKSQTSNLIDKVADLAHETRLLADRVLGEKRSNI